MKSRLINRIGTAVMILLILLCVPFTVPKLFGLQIYEVKSESMEPEYPVGSVVYVKAADASDIMAGDVITYTLGTDTNLVMTHRVIDIVDDGQSFITKGDANPVEDAEPVSSNRLVGVPVLCIPGIAAAAGFMNTGRGKAVIVCLFVLVFILWRVAEWLQKKEQSVIKNRDV